MANYLVNYFCKQFICNTYPVPKATDNKVRLVIVLQATLSQECDLYKSVLLQAQVCSFLVSYLWSYLPWFSVICNGEL